MLAKHLYLLTWHNYLFLHRLLTFCQSWVFPPGWRPASADRLRLPSHIQDPGPLRPHPDWGLTKTKWKLMRNLEGRVLHCALVHYLPSGSERIAINATWISFKWHCGWRKRRQRWTNKFQICTLQIQIAILAATITVLSFTIFFIQDFGWKSDISLKLSHLVLIFSKRKSHWVNLTLHRTNFWNHEIKTTPENKWNTVRTNMVQLTNPPWFLCAD